jgi:GTPase SAR1 family protein
LETIRQALEEKRTGIRTGNATCVIFGVQGVGKTQLALKYASDAFSREVYARMFWLSAETPEKLLPGYLDVLQVLDVPDSPDRNDSSDNEPNFESKSPSRSRWLIIVDNVRSDCLKRVNEMLPRNATDGHVIFIKRSPEIPKRRPLGRIERYTYSASIRLLPPSVEEAAQMLLSDNRKDVEDFDEMRKAQTLVRLLGCLPLAVNHVSLVMKKSQRSIEEVTKRLEAQKSQVSSYRTSLASLISIIRSRIQVQKSKT